MSISSTTAKVILQEFGTPEKYHSALNPLSPSTKNTENAIYKFRRISDGTSYIGMATDIAKRFSCHQSAFRHPNSEAGQTKLARSVQQNPSDMQFGILVSEKALATLGIDAPLPELEKLYINFAGIGFDVPLGWLVRKILFMILYES